MDNRQLGGLGFLVGNTALFANGLIAHLHANTPQSRKAGVGRMAASAVWGVSSLFLVKYGDRPVEAQQARLQEKLAGYLQQAGVPLDAETLRKADAQTRHGWFSKLEDFFYAHPIECGNAYYAAGATGFAVSGRLRRSDGNQRAGNANIGVGALSLAGAFASILIPEKTPEQIEAQGQTGTVWGNIQKHPLGYVRWLFLAADAMAGLEAVGEFQAAKKMAVGTHYRPWQFAMAGLSAAAMVTTLASDWLTSGSKKAGGTPKARAAAQETLLHEAASHIAALPEAQQQQLTQTLARYLVQQHELRFQDRNPQQLAAELLQQVHAYAQQPAAVSSKPVMGAFSAQAVLTPTATHQLG